MKNKVKSDIFDTKPKSGEVGLEITGDSHDKSEFAVIAVFCPLLKALFKE